MSSEASHTLELPGDSLAFRQRTASFFGLENGKAHRGFFIFSALFIFLLEKNGIFLVVLISSLNVFIIQHFAVQTSCFYHPILAEGVSVNRFHDGVSMHMCHCILCSFMPIPQCPSPGSLYPNTAPTSAFSPQGRRYQQGPF